METYFITNMLDPRVSIKRYKGESEKDAHARISRWLSGKEIGSPRELGGYTVDVLKEMGYVGIYSETSPKEPKSRHPFLDNWTWDRVMSEEIKRVLDSGLRHKNVNESVYVLFDGVGYIGHPRNPSVARYVPTRYAPAIATTNSTATTIDCAWTGEQFFTVEDGRNEDNP